jgi:hypothetical protein
MLQTYGFKVFAAREGASLVTSFVLAEMFYKFHSFSLEAGAFLGTWYLLSWASSKLVKNSS